MSTAAQFAANQANAQLSTGPKTQEGKAASSLNNFRHGCTGRFMLLPQEDVREFQALQEALNREHQPATPTEVLLVERMVEHFWLSQRAMRFQSFAFEDGYVNVDESRLALFMRYQATHERAFHKCLADLQKLRAEQRKEQKQLQTAQKDQAAETRKQDKHDLQMQLLQSKVAARPRKSAAETTPVAEPGNTPVQPIATALQTGPLAKAA